MTHIVKPNTLGGFVRSLSGLFITKSNPLGLTNAECTVLAALIPIAGNRQIKKEIKIQVASISNHGLQVVTNYFNRLKHKCAIRSNNTIHPILLNSTVIIKYEVK